MPTPTYSSFKLEISRSRKRSKRLFTHPSHPYPHLPFNIFLHIAISPSPSLSTSPSPLSHLCQHPLPHLCPYPLLPFPTLVQVTVDTPEGRPGPVQKLRVIPVGSNSLELNWDKPLMPNGIIRGYRVYFREVNGLILGQVRRVT